MIPLGRQLALQAFDGWDVPNMVVADPSPEQVALARQAWGLTLRATTPLGPPTGRYNCHGLVFASRRTNIDSPGFPVNIDELLHRDGYHRVDMPRVGDIIVYRHRTEVEHTGFVVRLEPVGPGQTVLQEPIVFVWSMWGSLGEFEHRAHVSPYHGSTLEYWRLHP